MTRRYEIPERTELVGGFDAMLTATESNAWSDLIRPHPVWLDFLAAKRNTGALQAVVMGGEAHREQEYRNAMQTESNLRDRLYQIGKEWYAELTAKDEKEREAAGAVG